ncbi:MULTISPECIES: 16S rRNA (uracil(1498)-N(3))-methyltransferase [Aneurinibacillus]|uniref:Ribosomal RNA small subunit methyltransferase E n=1 Tax=Aneurinibacillus thermoaerophilus TaxID=143495 RepID=A0A1G7Z679_ANETH|nr:MULTISPECIES: 16S rRNA (uracil(1498)-N(3))-methyltransferase [Aneurinibacillus]AMA72332.1 16S rRNA methyltransferase [Aneurinibacillus sp. XH2]MED0674817.1 16S rRNA (uracil(1498)-N(3))-methyltransferase [Aneurinibacillus thermoaerophilus]MED0679767.1 16S rRNA (uracil(1498)-N(3))-methyltransferase [Aneurinibacillus thermoaerophilus]MED0735799.1 16S rRNA (uracil(1498)-N(3))-methyltransferase [Aneurinibacillus thermoaerophilus]MED0758531.1 16S rRNA (uracil(1498)-N(3))-methyltransferase [Aneuri
MQRYFVNPSQMNEQYVTIVGDDVNHIAKVMRFRSGDEIICCNGQGRDVRGVIEEIQPNAVRVRILREEGPNRELPVQVTIAQGLVKGDKMEVVIQKGTELGAFSFCAFTSMRTVVKLDEKKERRRLERWQKIAKEAAEQSHRSHVPIIENVLTWRELLASASRFHYALFAYEKEETVTLHRVLAEAAPGSKILIVIGPEGGFDEKEVAEAEAAGFLCVSLGRRILRAETAPLYALSCVSYQFEQQ